MLFAVETAGNLQAAEGSVGGGNLIMLVLMGALLLFFLILPMRKQKKTREEIRQRQSTMGPGTQVMTQFGLYGTVAEINQEQGWAILELSPGITAKVHLQTVTTVLDENGMIPGSPQAAQAAAAQGAAEAEQSEGQDHADGQAAERAESFENTQDPRTQDGSEGSEESTRQDPGPSPR